MFPPPHHHLLAGGHDEQLNNSSAYFPYSRVEERLSSQLGKGSEGRKEVGSKQALLNDFPKGGTNARH